MERKLTAILSADVAGYSRLVENDDESTIRTLTAYRELIGGHIEAHHGRVVDAPGDNLLAEFSSVVDAVRCAVEIQQALHARNAEEDPDRRMAFRMGINVGDVIVEGRHLYGDGINIAARLEGLADPGGICLSGNAYEQVENKLDTEFEFAGEQTVKNISKPVAVWRARITHGDGGPERQGSAIPTPGPGIATHPSQKRAPGLRMFLLAVGIALAVVAAFLVGERPVQEQIEVVPSTVAQHPIAGSEAAVAADHAQVSASERPAIIVLPFSNISDDPKQDYFSDGITEDITTDLSKLHSLYVVPSNAAFKYKGNAIAPQTLKEEFGVRYLLEGSVRKAANQVRISARLIDIVEDRHLWGERYDRPLTDIFALQDEICGKILTALRVNLTPTEQKRFLQAPTTNLEAYDFYLRAQEMSHRARRELRPELMDQAAALFNKAIELDPDYSAAYGALGLNEWVSWLYQWTEEGDLAVERAVEHFDKSLALDNSNPRIIRYGIAAKLHNRQHDLALAAAEEFVERAPEDPIAHRMVALVLAYTGRIEEALESLQRSKALSPRTPPYHYWIFGVVLNLLGRDDEAIDLLSQAISRAPNYLTNHVILTAIYAKIGRHDEARQAAEEILRISPKYNAEKFGERLPFTDTSITDDYIAALRQAGLP